MTAILYYLLFVLQYYIIIVLFVLQYYIILCLKPNFIQSPELSNIQLERHELFIVKFALPIYIIEVALPLYAFYSCTQLLGKVIE